MKNDAITTSSQDYLETILLLSGKDGAVRSVDVANAAQVSRASVSKAVGILKDKGLLKQEKYGALSLTREGARVANSVKQRHNTLRRFLTDVLGVNPETAEGDACKMEHAISLETLEKLECFLNGR